jgi:prepilin-type N-terminal cleavage/methylation domain-containing protein
MDRKSNYRALYRPTQTGMSLLEMMIALAILLIASVGIISMATTAMSTTENQGHLAARASEYAQDKMEQLNSLAYGDASTDTTQFPACSTISVSPPACTTGTGLTIGGSSDPNNPVATPGNGYADYLDISGNPTTSTGSWYYVRVWQISPVTGQPNLKQITVTTKVRRQVGSPAGALPQTTLVSLKANPF